MNDIQIFRHDDFGEMRTIIIDGEVWFVGVDVAKALEYKDPSRALRQHVDKEDKRLLNTRAFCPSNTVVFHDGISGRGNPNITIINESGLYSLVLSSKLERAKKFKRWVTSEVLPTIRKTGGYGYQKCIDCRIFEKLDYMNANINSLRTEISEALNEKPLKSSSFQTTYKKGYGKMKKRITDNSIFYLKSKENLIRYMDLHGKRVTNNPNASIMFACPFCNSGNHERRNSDSGFSIYSNRNGYGKYHCFSCDSHGDIINVHAELHGKNPKSDFLEICEELAKELCITLDYEDGSTFKPVSNDQKVIVKQSSRRGRVFNHVDFTPKNQDKELTISPRKERQHIYTNENGQSIAIKKMKIRKDGSKSFLWYLIDPETGRMASKTGLNGLELPLYNLCAVNQARADGQTVFVVEGEKDVDTLQSLGYIATTKPNGAQNRWTANFIEPLKDLNVIVLLDNDEAGADCGKMAITALLDVTSSLKVIPSAYLYPELPNKGDISDIVDILGTERTKELLDRTIADEKYIVTEDTPTEEEQDNNTLKKKKPMIDYELFSKFIEEQEYSIKYNQITHDFEFFGFDEGESKEHLAENVPTILQDQLEKIYTRVTKQRILDYITRYATRHKYNPVLNAIKAVKWDGLDRVGQIYDIFKIPMDTMDDYYSRVFILKWLKQCVCGLFNDIDNPFSLDIILVFQGKQGIGKTRFFEMLALNSRFFGEGICLDPRDKDSIIQSTSKWISELGELGSTMKKDMDSVKAFLTKSTDEYRTPYGKASLHYPRMTSFVGTVNDNQFLIDQTGNRRFVTVPLSSDLVIDYKTQIKTFDALQLWAQIYHLVKDKDKASCFRLTEEEKLYLEQRNSAFVKPMKGECEVLDILEEQQTPEQGYTCTFKEMTVLQFIQLHNLKYDANVVGKVLKKHGYEAKRKKVNGETVRVIKLPYKKYNSTYGVQ
ncbi:MAG: hypothetical protein K2K16_13090 [Ruminococcus sp.]|nr:hypothetical protein [Ruminococcus sp.]